MIFPQLDNLGLDINKSNFWRLHLINTYGKRTKEIVNNVCLDYNIKNTTLNENGLIYLLQKTHILRYVHANGNIEKSNLFELLTSILFALFLSGEENEIVINKKFLTKNFYVLDGTNLCLDFSYKHEEIMSFIPQENNIKCGLHSIQMLPNEKNFVFEKSNEFFYTLPYDSDTGFIFFFIETNADEQSYDRYLLESTSNVKREIEVIKRCKEEIILINPNIWSNILQHIIYISFTTLDGFESSTDPRELRNSIIINMRLTKGMNELEKIAWAANGLYHESKHNQYVDAVFFEIPPYETKKEYKSVFEIEEKSVIAPWKGLPQNRTLTQILLGMHAFVPGLYICFKILIQEKNKPLSLWLKGRIEEEMRSINGTVSIMLLSEAYLNKDGLTLSNRLIEDFFNYLSPSYNELIFCRKEIEKN